jgi:drug/metabolite transporter (DMT)-like permease
MKFQWSGVLLAAALVATWSSGYIGAKIAVAAGPVLPILFWRFFLIAVVLAPFAIAAARKAGPWPLAVNAALGFFAMFVNIACGALAIEQGMPAGTLAIIYSMQPLATAAAAGPVLGEHVPRRQWIGLLIAFAGVTIASGLDGLEVSPAVFVLALMGMAGLVFGVLAGKAWPVSTPPVAAIGVQSAMAALAFLLLALMNGSVMPPAVDQGFLASVAWFIVFSTLGAYGFFWMALRRFTATRVGAILYLSPPFTLLVAWLAFGEPITAAKVIGLVICLAGVVIAMR